MSLLRIIIGTFVGGLVSIGLGIGLIYGGIQVSWWLAIVLCIIGFLIGGFVAGYIAQDKFPGMIAGLFTGLLVFAGIFLFTWLILKAKILNWFADFNDIDQTIDALLGFMGITETSNLGIYLTNTMNTKFSQYSDDINQLANKYVPLFCFAVSGIFGFMAVILGGIAGRIGGRFNKIDELTGD